MRRSSVLAAVAVLVAMTVSDLGYRVRQQERAILRDKVDEYVSSAESGRYVDVGVELRVVRADPDGEQLIDGKPRMRMIGAPLRFGGIADVKADKPAIVGPSRDPQIWFASEDQAAALLFRDPKKRGQLVYGSEGAGKSTLLALFHYLRWIENFGEGREGGQTAPTGPRLEFVRAEMFRLYPREWFRYYVADEKFVFVDGTRIQEMSTHRQSEADGSRIQGFNWSWCGRDEAQDQIDVHNDIESRGRAAHPARGYKQLATATAKDDSDWRTLRDTLITSGRWERRQMSIYRSPFVASEFIEEKRDSMSLREFLRRYGKPDGTLDDLPPEHATYPAWSRTDNLVTIPDIGWVDVTARELATQGEEYSFLVGHDPGSMWDVSIILKAFARAGEPLPIWVVVDELTTERTTTEQHVSDLLHLMRSKHHVNLLDRLGRPTGPRMFVRADPYGNNDSKPDRACYTLFRNEGISIKPAAFSEDGDGPGRIPKREGIEVVNMLLCNASLRRRLFVAKDAKGKPVAPKLVDALESSELDDKGNAETEKKNKKDKSHWPAALRYALWAIERPRLGRTRTA